MKLIKRINNIFLNNRKINELQVGVGQHNLKTSDGEDEVPAGGILGVKEIAIHPSYVDGKVANDIALIRLDNQIQWSSSVQPVCLPAKHRDAENHQHQSFSGRMATVAGWGSTIHGNTIYFVN